MSAPGFFSRQEPASGLLVRGILVNGNYLLTESCTINPQQTIDLEWFIQGGPLGSIANFDKKFVEGKIVCPVRVDGNGALEPAIQTLLNAAQNPQPIRLDTNHLLSNIMITAEHGGTDNNALVSLDCMVIKDLTLTSTPTDGVKLNVGIIGMIDSRTVTSLIARPEGSMLGRQLSWQDCNAKRFQSAMRTVAQMTITISNEVETPVFMLPATSDASHRSDQISLIGVKKCKWGGSFEEILRMGIDTETYIHGGWMVGENLTFQFGPIKATIAVPLFKIGQQPLSASILKRTTEFFSQNSPSFVREGGTFFTYSE